MFFFKRAFGLDISDYSLYALELSGRRRKMKIRGFARGVLGRSVVENGQIKDKRKLASALKKLLAAAEPRGIKRGKVICCLPESKIFTYIFSFPRELADKQLEEAMKYKVKEVLPMDLEEVYFDFQVTSRDRESQDVFFAAAPKSLVEDYIEVLGEVGLEPVILDMESAGLARALIKKSRKKTGSIILDIGGRSTHISIYDKNGIRLNLSLELAGESITEKLAQKMKISHEEAEKIKRKNGLDPQKNGGEALLIIQAVIQPIIDEIERAVNFYENSSGRSIDEIILCGGSAKMPKLREYLSDNVASRVKLQVNIGDPLIKINQESLLKGKGFKTQAVDFATVIGLAMRSFKSRFGINLLPRRGWREKLWSKRGKEGAVKSSKSLANVRTKDKKIAVSESKVGAEKKGAVVKKAGAGGEKNTKEIIFIILLLAVIVAGSVFVVWKFVGFRDVNSNIKTAVPFESSARELNFIISVEEESGEGAILGKKASKMYSWSKSFAPGEFGEEEDIATGIITIINEASYDQPLVATTRFLSAGGILFRLKERVLIPAGGRIEAEVYADQPGVSGNIGPDSFTIPGLPLSVQDIIYGQSDKPMSGGVKRVGVVSEADISEAIDKATDNSVKAIIKKFSEDLNNEHGADYEILEELLRADILSAEASVKAGEEVEEFSVTVNLQAEGLIFRANEVNPGDSAKIESFRVNEVSWEEGRADLSAKLIDF